MTADFTLAELERAVRTIAALNPHHVYHAPDGSSRCQYVDTDTDPETGLDVERPGCIMGYALSYLGVSFEMLEHNLGIVELLDELREQAPTREEDRAMRWFGKVQEFQDNHDEWGEAVRWADEDLEEYDYDCDDAY